MLPRTHRVLTFCINGKKKNQQIEYFLSKTRFLSITGNSLKKLDLSKYSETLTFSRSKYHKKKREALVRKERLLNAKKHDVVTIKDNMTLNDFALEAKLPIGQVIKAIQFVEPHRPAQPYHKIEKSTLIQCASVLERRYKFENLKKVKGEEKLLKDQDVYKRTNFDMGKLSSRPPIVTIMGHVDHGKTTLLDSLRKTSIAEQEAGGITQKIGAFAVEVSGRKITFLDTPGHASFSAMRQRGAQLTDLVVLVVAADDGVMEQTIESIKMIKKAEVEVIVAINKCDLPNAQPRAVSEELIQHGIQTEDCGGTVQSVQISAKTGKGVPNLLESLFIQADILGLQADRSGNVEGIVVESRQEDRKGFIGSCVIQQGTLTKGKFIVAGSSYAKVKSLQSESGAVINKALPSFPVDIIGWKSLPTVGENVIEVPSLAKAKLVIKYRENLKKLDLNEEIKANLIEERKRDKEVYTEIRREVYSKAKRAMAVFNETKIFYTKKENEGIPEHKIILKADVDGSLDAILHVLQTYNSQDQCVFEIIESGVGPVTKHDVELGKLFNGSILSFNQEPSSEVVGFAAENSVEIHHTDIIYQLVEILKSEIENIMPPQKCRNVVGEAEVLKTFEIRTPKKLAIGINIISGSFNSKLPHIVLRGDDVIFEGNLLSMKHHTNPVEEMHTGSECAIIFEDDHEVPVPGDIIQCCHIFEEAPTLKWNPPGF